MRLFGPKTASRPFSQTGLTLLGSISSRTNCGAIEVMVASKRRASCSSNASMKFVGEIRDMIAAAVSAARLLWLHGSHEAYSMPLNLCFLGKIALGRSEEHTSELKSLMRISYAV